MGEVHRGIRIGSDDQMAVKVLRSERVADPEVLARFLQERSMLCSLVHPNLVRVHDLAVEGDRPPSSWSWSRARISVASSTTAEPFPQLRPLVEGHGRSAIGRASA